MSQPEASAGWPDPYPPDGGSVPEAPPPGLGPTPEPGHVALPGAPPAVPPYPPGAYAAPPGPIAYGMGGYPHYGYAPPPPTNGMAIGSLVVSILSAVGLCAYGIGGLLGVVGAVLGHVARRQIRERGESGESLALAGVIIGWIAFGIAAAAVAVIVALIAVAATA